MAVKLTHTHFHFPLSLASGRVEETGVHGHVCCIDQREIGARRLEEFCPENVKFPSLIKMQTLL